MAIWAVLLVEAAAWLTLGALLDVGAGECVRMGAGARGWLSVVCVKSIDSLDGWTEFKKERQCQQQTR